MPSSGQDLERAQYRQGPLLTVPGSSSVQRRPLPQAASLQARRHRPVDTGPPSTQERNYFHAAAKKNDCKSYLLHRNIRGRATYKDAQPQHKERRENQDWNYVFPPSVVDKQCNAAAVRGILDCDCRVCKRFAIDDLTGDDSILYDLEHDPEVRFSVAVLAYMGAGYAIRALHRCDLGKPGFSLATKLESPSLVQEIIGPLQREPRIPEFLHNANRPITEVARDFTTFYEETRMLLRSPRFKASMSTTELQGCNLPFLHESSMYPNEPQRYPHLSTLDIHPDYRDESIPAGKLVRKKLYRAAGANDEAAGDERNILKFIAEMDRKNIIKLHCWFTYDNIINLVFPKYPGTLEDVLLEKWGPGRRSQFSSKFRGSRLNHWLWEEAVDIVGALAYIHNPPNFNGQKVIMAHFDLKPANILVNKEGHLVITDFGIARIKSLATGNTTGLLGGAGTLAYAPPEGNRSSNQTLNRAYDVWSMGCILLEIVIFVLYDKGPKNNINDIVQFAAERLDEGIRRGVQSDQSFWKEGKNGHNPILKDTVDQRLKQLEQMEDVYLSKSLREIRNSMLNTIPTNRHTAQQCHVELRDDHILGHVGARLMGQQVVAVGEDTVSPIHRMSIFFDSKDPERLSQPSIDCQLRCFILRSHNHKKDKWRVVMNFESPDGRQKEHSDCGYLAEEEFVPISSYINPRIPGTPFQFRMTSIHPQITFKLNDERDFFRIQAGFTRQQVRVPKHGASNIPIKRCWFKRSSLNIFDPPTKLKVSGCVQIWDQLSEDEYRDTMTPDTGRVSHSGSASGSGSGSSSVGYPFHALHGIPSPTRANTIPIIQDTAPKQSTKANPTRIVIFLSSDPAQKNKLTMITLNMAYQSQVMGSEHICKDKDIPEKEKGNFEACVTFNTLAGHKSFNAGCFEDVIQKDAAGSPINISPGVPLDPMTLHNKENDGETSLKWLELEFNSKADRDNFVRRVNQSRLEPYESRVP